MRKNIFTLLALQILLISALTGCSKKAVVLPKQTDKSALVTKPGTTTGSATTTQGSTTHTCGGGGGYNGGSSGSSSGN